VVEAAAVLVAGHGVSGFEERLDATRDGFARRRRVLEVLREEPLERAREIVHGKPSCRSSERDLSRGVMRRHHDDGARFRERPTPGADFQNPPFVAR
jgi:hypothetical protein